MNSATHTPTGTIVSIHGSVVDVRFDGVLPAIHTLLTTGDGGAVIIEVLTQLDASHVRGIALTATAGLSRGMQVNNTGAPLKAPVGKATLSRMFDVFGRPIDLMDPPHNVAWRSIHRNPPPLSRRSTKSEIFET